MEGLIQDRALILRQARPKTSLMAALGLALALGAQAAYAEQYYIYEEADGTRWLTDHRIGHQNFKLVGRYGRPTASASCAGINGTTLEERAQTYWPTVTQYAEHHRIDNLLVKAIIAVESCFDAYAVSRVGAQGLMQLMPATAEEVGVYNAFNASDNIRGGVRYFRMMLDRFDDDLELALAAYNAGPTAVERYGGIPPYKETQNYVKRVLTHYARYRDQATTTASAAD